MVVHDTVVFDGAFGGAAAVIGGGGGRQVPFDEGGAGDERNVVEVLDVEVQVEADAARFGDDEGGHLIPESIPSCSACHGMADAC